MPSREIAARETKSPHTRVSFGFDIFNRSFFQCIPLRAAQRITDNPQTMHVVNY